MMALRTTQMAPATSVVDATTEIRLEFVTKEPFPAWTAVGVTALYEPEAIVEISVHALVPPSQRR
jgi:enamine deaminase RidA (YjgF/YER057c/UK114 family)